jgi:hypothetical protein
MIDPDPYENDPFLKRFFDGTWNACIGLQGHEENYMDSYIEYAFGLPHPKSGNAVRVNQGMNRSSMWFRVSVRPSPSGEV